MQFKQPGSSLQMFCEWNTLKQKQKTKRKKKKKSLLSVEGNENQTELVTGKEEQLKNKSSNCFHSYDVKAISPWSVLSLSTTGHRDHRSSRLNEKHTSRFPLLPHRGLGCHLSGCQDILDLGDPEINGTVSYSVSPSCDLAVCTNTLKCTATLVELAGNGLRS